MKKAAQHPEAGMLTAITNVGVLGGPRTPSPRAQGANF